MKYLLLLFLSSLILFGSGCSATDQSEIKKVPVGIEFNKETIKRLGSKGDNWCMTWAEDGSQIVSMCDGNWLNNPEGEYHHHLYRIIGGPNDFQREDIPNFPEFRGEQGSWFGYGIVSVDGIIYSAVSKTPGTSWSGPFLGIKLLKSSDNGNTWYRVDRQGNALFLDAMDSMRNVVNNSEMFFLEEYGIPHKEQVAFPFSYFEFVQHGQDNSAARDDYIYMYSPEGAHAHKLTLARVEKGKLGFRSEWQYFTGYDEQDQPEWSNDILERGYVYEYAEKSTKDHYFGWYSWLPSVVWNEGLNLYIMVNGGTYAGTGMTDSDEDYYDNWMHTETGSLGFWYSERPYGPWHQFFYTDYWVVDDVKNRTYQPKLSPKWISDDGTEMILNWSDAMMNEEGRSHTVNYLWNQMKIKILTEEQ